MKRIRLTMSQALVKFLDNQYIECDGVETKFVSGMFGIFGHGCVVGVGQALEQGGHNLKFYQGKNEQNMALAAVAYAKQMDRKAIIPCVSSIGPGATNMVTACGCATANRIPLLVLPGKTIKNVLVFEVPKKQADEISTQDLQVEMDGQKYQVTM